MVDLGAAYDPYMDYPYVWSNCYHYVRYMRRRYGGYGVWREGHNGVPVHFLYVPPRGFTRQETPVYSFEPLREHWSWRLFRSDMLIWFRGQVVKGDEGVPSHAEIIGSLR